MNKSEDKEGLKIETDKNETDYTSMGIPLGLCFGSAIGIIIGTIIDDIALGLCYGPGVGMCLGILISSAMKKADANEKEEDREKK